MFIGYFTERPYQDQRSGYFGHAGRDITEETDAEPLLLSACPLPPGRDWCRFTAAVVARLVRALCSDVDVAVVGPGPLGVPGGYPSVAKWWSVQGASSGATPMPAMTGR